MVVADEKSEQLCACCESREDLFVNMGINGLGPVADALFEPHFQFVFRALGAIASVANISSQIDRVVPADATRLGCQRLCLREQQNEGRTIEISVSTRQ